MLKLYNPYWETLDGGLTNKLYKVTSKDGCVYVLRISGEQAHDFGASREAELQAISAASGLRVTPEVLYQSQDGSMLLQRFVTGTHLEPHDLKQNKVLFKRTLKQLKKLHNKTVDIREFDPIQWIEDKWNVLGQSRIDMPAEMLWAYEYTRKLAQKPCGIDSLVFCHNDLHAGNIIQTPEQKIVLLDWDYAGRTSVFYELANFVNHYQLNQLSIEYLLKKYFGIVEPEFRERLKAMRIVAYLWNGLWYAIKLRQNPKETEFQQEADLCYQGIGDLKQSFRF